jgi:hypothetical protein
VYFRLSAAISALLMLRAADSMAITGSVSKGSRRSGDCVRLSQMRLRR